MKIKKGDKVMVKKIATNLGAEVAILGKTYIVKSINPKVRVTYGTGLYFVNLLGENKKLYAANLIDCKKVKT